MFIMYVSLVFRVSQTTKAHHRSQHVQSHQDTSSLPEGKSSKSQTAGDAV